MGRKLLGHGVQGIIVAGLKRREPRQRAPGVIETDLVLVRKLSDAFNRTAAWRMQQHALYSGRELLLKFVELPFGVELTVHGGDVQSKRTRRPGERQRRH